MYLSGLSNHLPMLAWKMNFNGDDNIHICKVEDILVFISLLDGDLHFQSSG